MSLAILESICSGGKCRYAHENIYVITELKNRLNKGLNWWAAKQINCTTRRLAATRDRDARMTTPLPGHLGRLPAAVQEAMRVSVEAGALGPADLDPSVVAKLAALPEAAALICVKRFLAADLGDVGNKTGFLVGIIARLRRETPAALAGGPAPVAIAAGHGDFNKTLWVGNLPSDVRVEQLRAVFGCIGVIRDLRLAQGGNIAFVEYEKAEDAAAARQLDGARLGAGRRAGRRPDPRRSDATEQSVARGAAVRATARVVAPLVPRERAAAVGGRPAPRSSPRSRRSRRPRCSPRLTRRPPRRRAGRGRHVGHAPPPVAGRRRRRLAPALSAAARRSPRGQWHSVPLLQRARRPRRRASRFRPLAASAAARRPAAAASPDRRRPGAATDDRRRRRRPLAVAAPLAPEPRPEPRHRPRATPPRHRVRCRDGATGALAGVPAAGRFLRFTVCLLWRKTKWLALPPSVRGTHLAAPEVRRASADAQSSPKVPN